MKGPYVNCRRNAAPPAWCLRRTEKRIALNGELRFVTKISIKRRNDGFVVHQDFLEHNSKPNCQGKSPEYMLSRFVHDIYFERNDAFLRQYIWTKETGRFIEFVRTRST